MSSANLVLVILSFLLHGIGYFSSSYRWQLLLKAQGFDVSISYLMRSYAIGMFFNNLLPSTIGGDAYRALDTAKCNIPKLKAFAIVFVERLLGLFALVLFTVFALLLATELTTYISNLWLWSLVAFLGMLVMIWMIFFQKTESSWLDKVFNLPGMSLVQKYFIKVMDSVAPFSGKSTVLIWSLLLSLLLQLNVILHYYLISEALDLTIPFVKYLVLIPLAMFVQMIPISINGIGLRESFYVFTLSTIYQQPIEATLAFSLIAYGMTLLLGILGGVIYAFRR